MQTAKTKELQELENRIETLEKVVLEYAAMYGLTAAARNVMPLPKQINN